MHVALRRLLAGALRIATNILPEPDGRPRPPTEAQLARKKNPVRIRMNEKTLDYKISQQDLSHIFRLHSSAYEAAVAGRSVEIRNLAGYATTGVHQDIHGFGATKVIYADKQLNLYVNENLTGVFSGTGNILARLQNMMNHVSHTISNIPKAVVNARTLKGLVAKAHDHEAPGSLCEMAIVAQKPIVCDDPKRVIFTIQAEQMRDQNIDSPVILRRIFKPVVDADGNVTGTAEINPRSPDADIETLRFLIFSKLVMNQMISKQHVDIAGNLKAVTALPLDKTSKLKDYLSFQPPA